MLDQLRSRSFRKSIAIYNTDQDYKNAAKLFYLTYKLNPIDTAFMFNAAVSATQAKDFDTALVYYKELKDSGYTGITTEYLSNQRRDRRCRKYWF